MASHLASLLHRPKVIQHMWVINSELMQQDGRRKKTENNKICTYNHCHAVHSVRLAVFFSLPSYCASSLPINYQIEFYHPVPWWGFHVYCCCADWGGPVWFGYCTIGTCEYGGGSSTPPCWFGAISLGWVEGLFAAMLLNGSTTLDWTSTFVLLSLIFRALL